MNREPGNCQKIESNWKKKKKKKKGKSKIQWETGTNAGGWVKNPDFLKDTQMTCASGEVIRRGHAGGTTSSIPQRIITWHWIKYDLFFVILQFYNWLKVLKPVTLTLSLETISNKRDWDTIKLSKSRWTPANNNVEKKTRDLFLDRIVPLPAARWRQQYPNGGYVYNTCKIKYFLLEKMSTE